MDEPGAETAAAASEPEHEDIALAETLRNARPQVSSDLERRVGLHNLLTAILGVSSEPIRIGGFTVDKRVGEGGMGEVYRARSVEEETVAIKLMRSDRPIDRRRFDREAAVLRSIQHPRVCRYLEHGTTDDDIDYLVMEWLVGCDVATALQRGRFTLESAVEVARAAAMGLAAAHAEGVVHRDVKPNNLFLVNERHDDLRVIDFGLAWRSGATTKLTASGAVMGTIAYMAPEQCRGTTAVATDVYGLGASIFEMVAGRLPFTEHNPAALLLQVATGARPRVAEFRSGVPRRLDDLISGMLARQPADRPAMAEVIAELDAL